jgi:hypothetical protein
VDGAAAWRAGQRARLQKHSWQWVLRQSMRARTNDRDRQRPPRRHTPQRVRRRREARPQRRIHCVVYWIYQTDRRDARVGGRGERRDLRAARVAEEIDAARVRDAAQQRVGARPVNQVLYKGLILLAWH